MHWLDHPRTLALLVAGAFFMEYFDGTVIATALPQMARGFGVQPADLAIGMSAYLVTLAVLLPASGFLSERFGAHTTFCSAIAIFTLASVACGCSSGVVSFTAARIVQGAGGAMMVPVGRLAVLRTTPKKDLMRAIATLTWPALTAPILAPPLGGLITTYANWRWIFFINLPIGLLALLLALRIVPRLERTPGRKFDGLGFVLTGLCALGVMVTAESLGRDTVDWPLVAGSVVLALGMGLLAVRHAYRHPQPMVELTSLSVRTFAVCVGGGSLFRIAVSAVPFLLPLLFQIGFGLDAFHSGLLVLTLFVGNMAIKPATTPLIRRFGFRTTLIGNGLVAAASILLCATLRPSTPLPLLVPILMLAGASRSTGLTAFSTLAFADVAPERMTGANTLFNMLLQMSLGLGIAFGALALRIAEIWRPSGATAATPGEFSIAFVIVGVFLLGSVLDSLTLSPRAGAQVAAG